MDECLCGQSLITCSIFLALRVMSATWDMKVSTIIFVWGLTGIEESRVTSEYFLLKEKTEIQEHFGADMIILL